MTAHRPEPEQKLVETRKTERPRLYHRPMPRGWTVLDGSTCCHPLGTLEVGDSSDEDLADALRFAEATAELLRWWQHVRAVRAQDGAS